MWTSISTHLKNLYADCNSSEYPSTLQPNWDNDLSLLLGAPAEITQGSTGFNMVSKETYRINQGLVQGLEKLIMGDPESIVWCFTYSRKQNNTKSILYTVTLSNIGKRSPKYETKSKETSWWHSHHWKRVIFFKKRICIYLFPEKNKITRSYNCQSIGRKSHCVDNTVERSSYLYNMISYTGKRSLYCYGAQIL